MHVGTDSCEGGCEKGFTRQRFDLIAPIFVKSENRTSGRGKRDAGAEWRRGGAGPRPAVTRAGYADAGPHSRECPPQRNRFANNARIFDLKQALSGQRGSKNGQRRSAARPRESKNGQRRSPTRQRGTHSHERGSAARQRGALSFQCGFNSGRRRTGMSEMPWTPKSEAMPTARITF